MKWLRGLIVVSVVGAFFGASPAASDETKELKAENKREEIDLMAKQTLKRLLDEKEGTKEMYQKAYGYAVFSNVKLSFVVSGGGGSGVAVRKYPEHRTYMNMGTAGLSIGLGAKKYQVVFFFETKKAFEDFVEKGWQADASGDAVAINEGANVSARFVNGMAVYQLTDKGLMLQADIAGTKYWKSDSLNEGLEPAKHDDKSESKEEKKEEE